MKIAFLFGKWSCGTRPFDAYANNLYISTRGLTGSEISLFENAKWFAIFGWDVSIFTSFVPGTKPDNYKNIKLFHFDEIGIIDNSYIVVSINEPDILRLVPQNCLRIVCEYLNDFTFCQPEFENFVDAWTAPSKMLQDHLTPQLQKLENNWSVIPLGCDPNLYLNNKIPGRIISISSPDRGLAWFLSNFSKIKQKNSNIEFHIYYHLNGDFLDSIEPTETWRHYDILKLANMSRWTKYAIKKLEPFGVKYFGSSSRNQVAEALAEAEIIVCPLKTISFSEGFSCSTLEGLAAGCFPIISDIDCLGSIYGSVAPLLPSPIENHQQELVDLTVRALTDEAYRTEVTSKCREFASKLTWENSAKQLEQLITNHPKFKRPA